MTVSTSRGMGIAVGEQELSVPTQEEFVLGHRENAELLHPVQVSVAVKAELDGLTLSNVPPEPRAVCILPLECGRVSSVTGRTRDPPPGMNPLKEGEPHVRVAHDARVLLSEIPGHRLLCA
jgi:hypothetical protein